MVFVPMSHHYVDATKVAEEWWKEFDRRKKKEEEEERRQKMAQMEYEEMARVMSDWYDDQIADNKLYEGLTLEEKLKKAEELGDEDRMMLYLEAKEKGRGKK